MIRAGDTMENPVAGERLTFLETTYGVASDGKITRRAHPTLSVWR